MIRDYRQTIAGNVLISKKKRGGSVISVAQSVSTLAQCSDPGVSHPCHEFNQAHDWLPLWPYMKKSRRMVVMLATILY